MQLSLKILPFKFACCWMIYVHLERLIWFNSSQMNSMCVTSWAVGWRGVCWPPHTQHFLVNGSTNFKTMHIWIAPACIMKQIHNRKMIWHILPTKTLSFKSKCLNIYYAYKITCLSNLAVWLATSIRQSIGQDSNCTILDVKRKMKITKWWSSMPENLFLRLLSGLIDQFPLKRPWKQK